MANPEHLRILVQGANAWNAWRMEHPWLLPDLSEASIPPSDGQSLSGVNFSETNLSSSALSGDFEYANFTSAELSKADLRYVHLKRTIFSEAKLLSAKLKAADLTDADLRSADLTGADLREATLNHARLRYANLQQATLVASDLIDADLSCSDLRSADLRLSTLIQANLSYANMCNANLEGVRLGKTEMGGTDLTGVQGLDTCQHYYASVLDIQTIIKSGKLPLVFLRGCGLTDTYIQYLPSLLNEPIQFYACFISYSSKDQKFADRLYSDLQNRGVRCWLASEHLKIGAKIRPGIDEAIRMHDKLLLILSKHSVASDWVEQEVETAFERERREKRPVLFPIRIDDSVMDMVGGWPQFVRSTRNIGNFRRWKNHDSYQKAFEKLLRDLKTAAKS